MNLENKRVMVTGGYGFLGQWVEEKLMESGVASAFTTRHRDYDLRKRDHIERAFDLYKPQVVIHLAASVGGIQANYENPGKYFYDNIVMGAEMMDIAREREVEKFVQVGTSCSYPSVAPSPVKETDLWSGYPNEVTGAYGVAKLALITMAAAYRKQYGFNAITLIPVNLYGPKDSFDPKKSHVIPALITKTLEARRTYTPLTVWGTGDATREFLYVEDAAVAIVTATELYDSAEPVNIGTGIETSIKELVYLIAAALKFYGPIEFDPTKPEGQQRRVFDVSRAKREFGFEANTTLADGIERTVKWYLEKHA